MTLTQRGASLKQSQRDNEELTEMGKPRMMQQTSSRTFPPFFSTDTLAHLKYCGKSTRKSTDAGAKFSSSKGLRMLSVLVDDVIYFRTLYWASYRKSDKYIILYESAYPRLRDAYVDMVFNLPQTIRFVSEPGIRNLSPTIVSSNLMLSASGIIFGKSNSRIYFLKILFQSFNRFCYQ